MSSKSEAHQASWRSTEGMGCQIVAPRVALWNVELSKTTGPGSEAPQQPPRRGRPAFACTRRRRHSGWRTRTARNDASLSSTLRLKLQLLEDLARLLIGELFSPVQALDDQRVAVIPHGGILLGTIACGQNRRSDCICAGARYYVAEVISP